MDSPLSHAPLPSQIMHKLQNPKGLSGSFSDSKNIFLKILIQKEVIYFYFSKQERWSKWKHTIEEKHGVKYQAVRYNYRVIIN